MLNWKEDGQLDDKQNQKESKIPYRAYLQKNVRIFRLLFVLAFMITDAGLTIKNVTIILLTSLNNQISEIRIPNIYNEIFVLTLYRFWEHNLRLLWDLERIREGFVISIYKLQNVSPYCLLKQVNKILGIWNSEIWLLHDVSKIIIR